MEKKYISLATDTMDVARRRYGRRPLPLTELRSKKVELVLNATEILHIDSARGRVPRARWIRMAALGISFKPPISVHDLNALRILSRVAGNLATVAGAMRGGDYVHIVECRNAVIELRDTVLARSSKH